MEINLKVETIFLMRPKHFFFTKIKPK